MKVRLIQSVDGVLVKTEFDFVHIFENMELRGYKVTGVHKSPRTRAELQFAPEFSNLCGPMWDGDALRYEDRESYAALSA